MLPYFSGSNENFNAEWNFFFFFSSLLLFRATCKWSLKIWSFFSFSGWIYTRIWLIRDIEYEMIDRWIYSTCEKWIRNAWKKKMYLFLEWSIKIRENIRNKFWLFCKNFVTRINLLFELLYELKYWG